MAKLDCHFFPDTPASWVCDGCHTHYSERCVPIGDRRLWGAVGPGCLRCDHKLRFLGNATGAKPFWQMLPHFFAYPLHPNSLLVIALVTAVTALLGSGLSLGGGLILFLVALFLVAVVIKYSLAIIESRGRGETHPPTLGAVVGGDEHHLFLKMIALIFLMGAAAGFAGYVSELLGLVVVVFITLAMPASIMMLAVEKSVFRALNPLNLMVLMLRVGWPYLLLWFCTQVISAGPGYILGWLAAALPESMLFPLFAVLMTYFTFALYAMLGYVLFEYQNELGFDVEPEADDLVDQGEFDKARALGEATVLIRDGHYKQARTCLRRALDTVRDDIELHEHYHKLLMLLDDDEALANHGDYLIELYQRFGQLGKGVPIVLDVQSRVPGFQLGDTRRALELAPLLQMQGQNKAIIRLFHNRHKTRPKDPLIPAAYLTVARIFFEHRDQDDQALAIIRFVLKRYPDCRERRELEELQSAIHRQKEAAASSPA
ncbi:hypothetical protein [Marinimicrobium sp. C2-29]|uniref:hypothetical protein n=1 Tax=Marinimicrobium sp. C2-29 TaxID=3139825 RepID=UPI0031396E7B